MTGVETLADMRHQIRLNVARKVACDLGLDASGLWVCRTCGRAHLWQRAMCADCGKPYKESEISTAGEAPR